MATTAEEVEQILIADWHQESCGCRDFDGADLETCYSRGSDRYKYLSIPPMTWTVEDVLDAFDQVMARMVSGPLAAWSLADHAAIRDSSGKVHQVHHRDKDWLDFIAFPATVLYPAPGEETGE